MNNKEVLHQHKLEDIINEIVSLYSIEYNEVHKIVIEAISEVYESHYPVILEEDGLYAVYNDKNEAEGLKFFKIKYSAKKSKIIVSKIQDKSVKFYLNTQRKKVVDFIQNKKSYLHATYSYTQDNIDYYDLYYDKQHKYVLNNVKAITPTAKVKKTRIYIDYTTPQYQNAVVVFKEHKKFVNLNNLRAFTKDLNAEIYLKIQKKIWIEVKNFNLSKKEVYIHLPYKNTLEIIEYIKIRFKEVFGLDMKLIYKKKEQV